MMIISRANHFKFLAALVLCGMFAGCAPPPTASPSGNLSLDMRRLQVDLSRQQQAINDLEQRLATAEQRLEQQSTELKTLRQERSQPATTGYQAGLPIGAQPGAPASIRDVGEMSPTEIYLQAFGDYASGRYPQAIEGFQTFLQRFPNNSYASNAQFWLGDCYFNQQQYTMAIQAFQKGLDDYPRAPKNPDALLKIAMAQLQLGNTGEARQAIETLTRRYPESTAAKKSAELTLP